MGTRSRRGATAALVAFQPGRVPGCQTLTVSTLPPRTRYHRMLGWHAPQLRRAVIVLAIFAVVTVALLPFVEWELAVLLGWDAATLTFLATVWPIILRADGARTRALATREDETKGTAAGLLVGACAASLLGVGFALGLAGTRRGTEQVALIAVAVATVTLSWITMNTVYTLRYTHLEYRGRAVGVDFGGSGETTPDYRDFAYLAFTVGMTYQVSDTNIRDRRVRRTVLTHAGFSYVFGVVIVAGAINLIAGLVT
jgi:uncharacterized membrane protein